MAKLRCACGYVIPLSDGIPNPLEYKFMSDNDFDGFEGLIDAEEIYRACSSMFRCPQCGRLWVFWGGLDAQPKCYTPDPEEENDTTSG
jgi:hypothetical protein